MPPIQTMRNSRNGDHGAGDEARGFPPHKDGHALWWRVTNRGKRMATLDLRRPEGVALF